jgi:hypothetical protein
VLNGRDVQLSAVGLFHHLGGIGAMTISTQLRQADGSHAKATNLTPKPATK